MDNAENQSSQTNGVAPLSLASKVGEIDRSGIDVVEGGGVASALGFTAAGIHAGFRADPDRLDFGLVACDEPCAAAAVFTQNVFCAAPVTVSRRHLDGVSYGTARAVAVNSGNANAATGEVGLQTAESSAEIVADALGCTSQEVLVASTGVIGQHLDLAPFKTGAPAAVAALSRDGGQSASRAIMTTDTRNKQAAYTFSGDGIGFDGCTFTVGGMSKGAGMIMPNMATMIAVITTDAPLRPDVLHAALLKAVNRSFNKVTVDSDTSTNDSCFALASGRACTDGRYFEPDSAALALFERALLCVCTDLAKMMAADGEGATRLVVVRVTGAASEKDADLAARTVANSPLVKTAVFGHDANWGRIAGALGRSGAAFNQQNVSIDIMGLPVCRQGLTVPFDEEEALRRFERPEIDFDIDLGAGDFSTMMWTCDFSYEYVKINGDYRT